ncbi:MAG: DinB family protein [Alphaproteobacteria bacterium]
MMRDHLRRMARYNRWANDRLYQACSELDEAVYLEKRPAFFGSIHGTLNHILVGDRLWLARILSEPAPDLKLDDRPFADLRGLMRARTEEDRRMIDLTESYSRDDLEAIVRYRMVTRPDEVSTPLHLCWLHLFNHQTHHRGQIHDQLSQTDVPPPPLDLIYYLRETE